jgi:hypothetical protein
MENTKPSKLGEAQEASTQVAKMEMTTDPHDVIVKLVHPLGCPMFNVGRSGFRRLSSTSSAGINAGYQLLIQVKHGIQHQSISRVGSQVNCFLTRKRMQLLGPPQQSSGKLLWMV